MRRRLILKSTAVRFATIFVLIFAVTSGLACLAIYIWFTDELRDRQRSYIDDTRGTLQTVYRSGGLAGLRATVESKIAVAEEAGLLYLLTDRSGKFLAGNIREMPRFEGTKVFAWQDIPLVNPWIDPETPSSATVSWTVLPDGFLLLGDDDGDILEARQILITGLAAALLMMTGLAGLAGITLGRKAHTRISAIADVLNAAGNGRASVRVARNHSGDDLDLIGQHVNSTLSRLERVLESLKQVSADIAHDLKTPLARVQRRLQAVQSEDSEIADYRGGVTAALDEMDTVVRTFDALLSIAQLEAGFKKKRFRRENLAAILHNIEEAYTLVAEERGHVLQVTSSADLPLVIGDKELLTQLIANLVENSIRHCPSPAKIAVRASCEAERIVIQVCDNGPGVPEHERANVVRRLYRLEKSRTTPGNGLGLSLVVAIAELHDGTFSLEDHNPGLTARLSLPQAPEPALSDTADSEDIAAA